MVGALKRLNLSLTYSKLIANRYCPEVKELLQTIRPDWATKDNENMKSKELSGGYSNYMVKYYREGQPTDDAVIVRVSAEADPAFSHNSEIENMMYLHEAGRGPPILAYFKNGFALGFVEGVSLDNSTMREQHIQRLIAKEMVAFPKYATQKIFMHLLIAKEMVAFHKLDIKNRAKRATIWNLFHKFIDLAPPQYKDPVKNKQLQKYIPPKDVLHQELRYLKNCLDQLESPIVFCHNDLRPSNIIYDKQKDKVTLIDVELAMYNNEHFDIAYHFSEHTGVECMEFVELPDRDYQLSWLRYYLEVKAKQSGRSRSDVKDIDVEQCYVKVNKFSLAPNLGYAMWGLAMQERSNLNFDFLGYAQKKIEAYYARKEELLTLKIPD